MSQQGNQGCGRGAAPPPRSRGAKEDDNYGREMSLESPGPADDLEQEV